MGKQNKKVKRRIITLSLISSLLYLQLFCTIAAGSSMLFASDQLATGDRLDQAEENYYNGEFDKAIELVNQCLNEKSLSIAHRLRAHKILARTFLAKDDLKSTKQNIKLILSLEPSYQPTIEQETPRYVNLVAEMQAEQAQLVVNQKESGLNQWLLIGAGSAAAVALIVLVASGGGDGGANNDNKNNPLSQPPAFPE
jgi:hypothetical protein